MKIADRSFYIDVDQKEKKLLGAFYTPQELSDLMVSWAIEKPTDKVLEPSFGGCGFLASCANRYRQLGCKNKTLPLFGSDIDPNAFCYLANTVGGLVDLSRFIQADFLTLKIPKKWPSSFDVVIGNPPYISYQKISKVARDRAVSEIKELGFDIDLRSSLWAYFVTLSLRYLSQNGKIAWVLPGSFLHANYSHALRKFLNSKFSKIIAFQVKERLFLNEGTDETTVVLLGSGYNVSSSNQVTDDIPLIFCNSYNDLEKKILEWQVKQNTPHSCGSPILSLLSQGTKRSYHVLESHKDCFTLGDFASIKIGLVTGANKFFVLDRDKAAKHHLKLGSLFPLLAKFSSVGGLSFSISDHKKDLENGNPCLLVSSKQKKIRSKYLQKYIGTFSSDEIASNSTFKKRSLWYSIQDEKIPDAFFPVMNHKGPRIALNLANMNCTNSIYRVYFKEKVGSTTRKLIAISLLTNFSQLSAEIEGRKYGSGVLKHEPREAERIKVLIPQNICFREVSAEYSKINDMMKRGLTENACLEAERFIFAKAQIEDSSHFSETLSDGLRKARQYRETGRKKA